MRIEIALGSSRQFSFSVVGVCCQMHLRFCDLHKWKSNRFHLNQILLIVAEWLVAVEFRILASHPSFLVFGLVAYKVDACFCDKRSIYYRLMPQSISFYFLRPFTILTNNPNIFYAFFFPLMFQRFYFGSNRKTWPFCLQSHVYSPLS